MRTYLILCSSKSLDERIEPIRLCFRKINKQLNETQEISFNKTGNGDAMPQEGKQMTVPATESSDRERKGRQRNNTLSKDTNKAMINALAPFFEASLQGSLSKQVQLHTLTTLQPIQEFVHFDKARSVQRRNRTGRKRNVGYDRSESTQRTQRGLNEGTKKR